jgi:hypothetical protein
MKKNIIFIAILGILLTVLIQFSNFGTGQGDFLAYWSAAHLFVIGDNPYDQTAMATLQQSTIPERISRGEPVINAWNPPWLLLILAPVGILPYSIAFPVWIFCNTLLIGLVLLISWQMCRRTHNSREILVVFIAGYLFGETISYLAIGQITALVLLGMVLSIWWFDHQLDLLAGAILLLTVIKPQISYFFLILVLIWIIKHRRWKVIEGFVIAALTSMIIFWIIDPSWVKDYITLMNGLPFSSNFTSTIGSFFASIFHIKIFYFSAIILILLIKPILGILESDGWLTTLNLALIISLPLSPYGFSFDQIVILPSIVQIITWLWNHKIPTKTTTLIVGCLILFYAFVLAMLSINGLEYYWFFIIPIILLPIYLITWKMSQKPQKLSYGS